MKKWPLSRQKPLKSCRQKLVLRKPLLLQRLAAILCGRRYSRTSPVRTRSLKDWGSSATSSACPPRERRLCKSVTPWRVSWSISHRKLSPIEVRPVKDERILSVRYERNSASRRWTTELSSLLGVTV